ncbi:MAG: EamA family transporter [Candidatus Eremiobacteraeota bacterium]|nr:EamA family transporter [Candidatus Eremiobacteraeota bacterium]
MGLLRSIPKARACPRSDSSPHSSRSEPPRSSRYALLGAGPVAVSALRLAIAAVIALAVIGSLERLPAKRETGLAIAGIALAVHFAAWIGSLAYTSVALSTLLVTTTPIWTESYDAIRVRRLPSKGFAASLVLALVGVALVAFARPAVQAPVAGHVPLGNALALLGSFAIGAYLLIVRDAGGGIGTRRIVARTYGWAAVALVIATLAVHQGPPPLANGTSWAGILAMAFVSQAIGHTALNAALRDFSPSIVALTTLLEPVVAAALAAAIFHETLSWQAAIGGGAILVAIGSTLRRHSL